MGKYDSGYDLQPRDFYATPIPVTQSVLVRELVGSDESWWDPAAGENHIVSAFDQLGLYCLGTDLNHGDNFFDFGSLGPTSIITNPPYGTQGRLAVKFIEHALKLTKAHGGRVIMLLPVNFDSGKTRKHIFGDCPQFVRKYTLTDRIRWANLEQKEAGPKENHAWFVWSWQRLPGGARQLYIHGTGT